jgi:hypothetical protein
MNDKNQRPTRPVTPPRRPTAPTAAPGARSVAQSGTSNTPANKFRNSRPATWKAHNARVSDQDRVISIKTSEGRYIHTSCADDGREYPPNSSPFPTVVLAHMAPRVASSGGSVCAICNNFIVAPANKRAVAKAEDDWAKANTAFQSGQLSTDQFLAAAQRFASSRERDMLF